jgi:polyisoprenoid-binding protein YceI
MKFKKIFLSLLFLIPFIALQQEASASEWKIISSSVKFKIKNAGFTVDGEFGPVSGSILFDDAKLTGNSIDVRINSSSINTDNKTRDGHLRKKDYFNCEEYPFIEMTSTVFTKEKDGSYKGFFKLKIKNNSKEVIIPFSFLRKDDQGAFSCKFDLNRLDYGVGGSSLIMSDKVTVSIDVNVNIK